MTNKKFILLLLPFFIAAFAEAQQVKVKKEKSRVNGETIDGFEVELEGTLAEVNVSFQKFLRSMGKAKQSGNVITLNEANVNGSAYSLPLYGVTKENGKTTSAWIGMNESGEDDAEKINKELEKMIYDFGVKFYRDKIQVQIDESARAVQAVEKQQQRLLTENKNLNTKLENNKNQKIQLEKSLENNRLENETLLKKIEQNKKAQDSVAVAAEQIRKVVEMHKERQVKVN